MSASLHIVDPEGSPRIEAAAFVLALRSRGISDLGVLRAMETVPRELFAPRRYLDLSRQDVALPLAFGETMTAPGTVARMLAALAVRPGQRVLEIGTGSGYVTALLARIGASVCSAELHPVLVEAARHRLRTTGLAGSCEIGCGDGLEGVASEQRFDRICLNGALTAPPVGLTSRLAIGGRLVCGLVGQGGVTALATLWRAEDGRLVTQLGPPLRLTRLRAVSSRDSEADSGPSETEV